MEFRYTALNPQGRRINAIANSDSVGALVSRLKKEGLIPLDVSQVKAPSAPLAKLKLSFSKGIAGNELAAFTRQFATILNAGVVLIESLHTIAEDAENPYFRAVIMRIIADINAGQKLSQALSAYPKIFSRTYVAVVRSGEEIGNLGQTMEELADYLEEYERMKQKFINAIRYPIFLSCFIMLIVGAMVIFIIPKFTALFAKAGATLPLLTRIVISISEFWIKKWLLGLLIILGVWGAGWYMLRFFKARFMFDYYKLKVPIIGRLLHKMLIARFCRTFGILLSGGVGLVMSVAVASETIKNLFMQTILDDIKEQVIAGTSLTEALKNSPVIPRVMVKMVAVGEKSGKLNEMLKHAADYYDKELGATLEAFSAMIEPVFIIILGVIVLIVALALYLPIFHLSLAIR